MTIRAALMGFAAFALMGTSAAFAAEYLGGAVLSTDGPTGPYLTDAAGMTLYIFDRDAIGDSNCYEQCAVNWPPLFAEEGAVAEGDFTLVTRDDGTIMWAYKGWPLYYWINDTEPGQQTGDGVGDVWHTALE